MSVLREACQRISVLPYTSSLQPGLTFEQIEEITASLPFRLSVEVYELYQWRNGIKEHEPGFLFSGFGRFLPLNEAVAAYKDLYTRFSKFNENWFPIISMEESVYVVVGAEQQQKTSLVIDWNPEDEEMYVKHETLTDMLIAEAQVFEEWVERYRS